MEPFADNPYLPLEHAEALSLVIRLTERSRVLDKGGKAGAGGGGRGEGKEGEEEVREVPRGLHSSLKYCTKKNGLGRAAAEVRGDGAPWLPHAAAEKKEVRNVLFF